MNLSATIPSSNLLNRLAVTSFYVSATYAVLLWSPNSFERYFPNPVATVIFLLPWFLLWIVKGIEIISSQEHRTEILLLIIIIILGTINTILSDNPNKTYNVMKTFLLSGVMALWISMFLLTDPRATKTFDWFCCICLAIIASTELLAYFSKGADNPDALSIFALNPIPLGTLMILLSPGPFRLLVSTQKGPVITGWVLTGLGFGLILLTAKRGTFLAIIAMGLAWLLFKRNKLSLAISILLVLIALIVPFRGLSPFKSLDQNIPSQFNILHRLELYPFSLHVYLKHPVFGIGLRACTHEKYLSDYQSRQNLNQFAHMVKDLQTFDNMLLTSFVELGTLLTLAYLALITLIIVKYCRKLRPVAQSPPVDFYRLLVLIGFAVHSMTYDSLVFPSVNWLFYVQLGILAGYSPPTGAAFVADQ